MKDESIIVSTAAVEMMGNTGRDGAFEILSKCAENDDSLDVRQAAVKSLFKWWSSEPSAEKVIMKIKESSPDEIKDLISQLLSLNKKN